MGRRGPIPKSPALRALEGNPSRRGGAGQGVADLLTGYVPELGRTYETGAGLLLPRPEVRMLDTARRTAHRLAAKLGLTPASRARLGLDLRPPRQPAPADEFFA